MRIYIWLLIHPPICLRSNTNKHWAYNRKNTVIGSCNNLYKQLPWKQKGIMTHMMVWTFLRQSHILPYVSRNGRNLGLMGNSNSWCPCLLLKGSLCYSPRTGLTWCSFRWKAHLYQFYISRKKRSRHKIIIIFIFFFLIYQPEFP